jgi:uncharacterized protein YegL
MAGKPIEDLEIGVHSMLSALKRDPHAMETVFMSIITFDAVARVLTPLTELSAIQAPELSIHPGTAMGAALTLLYDSITRDVQKTSTETKGDYRPIVFLLTDGVPTDEWQKPAELLKNVKPSIANIYAIGCGNEVDFSTLYKITPNCIFVKSLTSASLSNLFVWLSASVQTQSVSASPDKPVSLEKVPLKGDMVLVDSKNLPELVTNPRIFLHCMCQEQKKFFLMRYIYNPEYKLYFSAEPVPLKDDFFKEGNKKGEQIDTSILADAPRCPYCGVNTYSSCPSCGTVICVNTKKSTVVCPNCGKEMLLIDHEGSITVDGSLG